MYNKFIYDMQRIVSDEERMEALNLLLKTNIQKLKNAIDSKKEVLCKTTIDETIKLISEMQLLLMQAYEISSKADIIEDIENSFSYILR